MKSFLAIDIGASGGKSFLGKFDGQTINIDEISRFNNIPVNINGYTHWDILSLYHSVLVSIREAAKQNSRDSELISIGIDSWGVDFGLLDKAGKLIGNPFHYRQMFDTDIMETAFDKCTREWLFERCPTHFQPLNTLYQIIALQRMDYTGLDIASTLLNIPSLLTYFLCGEKLAEYTMATTTQMYNPFKKGWDKEVIDIFKLPSIMPDITLPGTLIGPVRKDVRNSLCGDVNVVLPATHDTGSAVACIPQSKDRNTMFISAGTWCLTGIITDYPSLDERIMKYNFTNEGCYEGKNRILRNVTGLWLIQKLLWEWQMVDPALDYEKLNSLAERANSFSGVIDVDDQMLGNPESMQNAIKKLSNRICGSHPQSKGEYVRCALEGIALKVRWCRDRLEEITSQGIDGIHMIGGGIQNKLLCQFISNATGLHVTAGPVEGTAMGNIIGQLIANGSVKSFNEAQDIIKKSIELENFEPESSDKWDDIFVQCYKGD